MTTIDVNWSPSTPRGFPRDHRERFDLVAPLRPSGHDSQLALFLAQEDSSISSARFAQALPQLAEAAGSVGSLTFPELGTYLDEEQQKDTRTVSLFGTSLPARSLLGWGAWILVAVQLYLLLHLKDSASLRRTTEETRFPWIGVYRDPLARLVFLASITAVPVAAMAALGARLITLSGAEPLVASINFWQLSAAAVVSGALAILTFRSARSSA